ncbi:MAG TPA: hypothetical protein DCX25_03365 [Candidatus Pacebacteria bacterium]|nr:MAG: hypothetical protein UX00_C0001G0042 [Microgenomates group bacterium GW2011_GWB1_45_17]KKU24234.1 MAG: hypothetical protein UX36_C0002G0217 [Microgenomates group bacterium GW2011_GWC1_46_15]KKU24950.1 MAG: hypothetical protein UX35_C0001G0132 [Microgenomates group bacterium GW2011_GWA1_46_15]HAV15344.1 hypothetical protein [Candidatus Paceibacterota bacterium]HCR11384.1 hypothetical protein [Candidatus Paceibacterota bacterium]
MQIVDINGTERTCLKAFPDPAYPGYMRVEFRTHHEWFTLKEFLFFNPTLKNLMAGAPNLPADDLGVVTSSGKNFIRDAKKNWKENSYIDFTIWISRGLGEGQTRRVMRNTRNTVYTNTPWNTKPNKTSQYLISHDIHDVKAFGNVLPQIEQAEYERRAKEMDKKKAPQKN